MTFLKNKFYVIRISILLLLVFIISVCTIYVSDYYKADMDAIKTVVSVNEVSIQQFDDNIVFKPKNSTKGLIFYPGGKVEYTAYQPLMTACSNQGILCILIEMPFNLAVLDINAADGFQQMYPEIEEWYIGGHSLGGSMAASYLNNHVDDFDGLILLGSYSTVDLSKTELNVLSVYGSEDQVMNRLKYDENKSNLPSDFIEVVIEGGCHAYFGIYGEQEGDGKPSISNKEQIILTANEIFKMME